MQQIEKDSPRASMKTLPLALSIELHKAVKRKELSRSMKGLKALSMGEGYSFRPLQKGEDSSSALGGGLGGFLINQVLENINHIGLNGLVEVRMALDKKGIIERKRSTIKGDNHELCEHVWSYLLQKNKENIPFWKNLAASKRIKIKIFFMGEVNSRELASVKGGKSYISGDELLVFVYKRINPYNYSNSVNLLQL
ncbi:MAG: hypothetical protein ACJAT2_003207 [Bacteriovoracaceae bacterium]|jgi:hypothetical protein